MRLKKYLSNKEEFDYLIDHCKVTLRTSFDAQKYANRFNKISFNSDGTYQLFYKEQSWVFKIWQKTKTVNHQTYGTYFVELDINFNFNTEINRFYKKTYCEREFRSHFVNGKNADNVLCSELRLFLKREAVMVSGMRSKGYELFFKRQIEAVEFFKAQILSILSVKVDSEYFEWTLREVEICYDIVSLPDIELARKKTIRKNFIGEVDTLEKDVVFTNNGKVSRVPTTFYNHDSWGASGDRETAMLVGRFRSDKSSLKIYKKEAGKFGSVNRLERRFGAHSTFKKHLGGNRISGREDFKRKISILAAHTFRSAYNVLSVENPSLRKGNNNVLKEACRKHCGNKYWDIIYRKLKIDGTIYTGGVGAVDKRIIPVVRKAEAVGLLKRKSPGVYIANWKWLLTPQLELH